MQVYSLPLLHELTTQRVVTVGSSLGGRLSQTPTPRSATCTAPPPPLGSGFIVRSARTPRRSRVPCRSSDGARASSDKLRRCERCTAAATKGATLQHPGWAGANVGFMPFPVERFSAS